MADYLNPYADVNNAYQSNLGRPARQDEYPIWANDPNYLQGIQGSDEAKAYKARQQPVSTTQSIYGNNPAPPQQYNPPPAPAPSPAQTTGGPTGFNPPAPTAGAPPAGYIPPTTGPFAPGYTPPALGAPGTYQAGSPNDPSGGGLSWVTTALKNAQSTDDPAYWLGKIQADPKAMAGDPSAIAYWQQRIAQGDGALGVRNGTVQKFNDGPPPGTGAGPGYGAGTTFNDPAYQALNALAQARIQALSQPQTFPQLDQLTKMLTDQQTAAKQRAQTFADQMTGRIGQLQQPLMTDANVVQQHALASNNLIGSRDTALANAKQALANRGINPNTPGLATDQANIINQQYGNQQAQIDAQLQQANIQSDEQRRNQAAQLQSLVQQALQGGDVTALQEQAQVADLENQVYNINQNRAQQQLATAQIPVDLTNQGMNYAMGSAGNPTGDLTALMSLIMPSLTAQQNQFNQSNQQTGGIMQLIQQYLTQHPNG